MGIKFDGTNVKNGSKVVANMKSSDQLRDGSSSGGKVLGNIKSRDQIRDGSSSGGKVLCNVKDGKNIKGALTKFKKGLKSGLVNQWDKFFFL